MLEIEKKLEEGVLTFTLTGRLDTITSRQLENEIPSLYGVTKMVFDFSKLEYMSSAGLRLILILQKKMSVQGSLVVKNPNPEIKELFDMTGFSDYLEIEE
jgi:anti-sigma B factor antagonist